MPDRDLIQAAARLARSSPDWANFLAQYETHSNEILKQVLSAPPELIQLAQGRAVHADELLRLLQKALVTAAQMDDQRK